MAGRSTKIVDPSKITNFSEWIEYSKYSNVQKTTDNQLLVLDPKNPNDFDAAKSIPHSYGNDYRVLLQSNNATVRAPGLQKLKELTTSRKTATIAAQTDFIETQKTFLAAVRDLAATSDESEKRKKVQNIVALSTQLATADEQVRTSSYPGRFVKVVCSSQVTRRLLNNSSMDDRIIDADLHKLHYEYETFEDRIIAADKA